MVLSTVRSEPWKQKTPPRPPLWIIVQRSGHHPSEPLPLQPLQLAAHWSPGTVRGLRVPCREDDGGGRGRSTSPPTVVSVIIAPLCHVPTVESRLVSTWGPHTLFGAGRVDLDQRVLGAIGELGSVVGHLDGIMHQAESILLCRAQHGS